MEIKQLRYFIAVADTLSFSRAAESVYLSQSALSRQISELEQELGVPLFIRSTRSVELTEAGRALQLHAKELISYWEKLVPEVKKKGNTNRLLSLTIGTDPRALADPDRRRAVLGMLSGMRQSWPGIRILIRNADYQEILKGVGDGSLDCALLLDRELAPKPELRTTVLGREDMVLAFRSRNQHTDADYAEVITKRGLILVDREPQGLYHIIHILNDLHLEPQIRFCGSLQDMTMTVETGESAMILPRSVYKKLDDPALQCLCLPSPYAALTLSVLSSGSCVNPMVPVLIEELKKLTDGAARTDTEEA